MKALFPLCSTPKVPGSRLGLRSGDPPLEIVADAPGRVLLRDRDLIERLAGAERNLPVAEGEGAEEEGLELFLDDEGT